MLINKSRIATLCWVTVKSPKRMGRPPLGHVRMFAYVPKEFADAIKDEARLRGKTLGQLIQEAFDSRITLYTAH